MGEGSGARAWLTGDVNGDGKTEIIQPWDNNGILGMIVYGWDDASQSYTKKFGSANMGQGSGAFKWLTGDVNGDGKTEIIQPWDNNNIPGMIVYGWDDASQGYKEIFYSSNISPHYYGYNDNR